MKRQNLSYFEVQPEGGFLQDQIYRKSSLILGRICFDVCLVVDKKLVLMERNVPPAKRLWTAGGRIRWNEFKNVYQYANLTLQEHLGLTTIQKNMHPLQPRFICFKERPYPEILTIVAICLTSKKLRKISINTTEQKGILEFSTKNALRKYMSTHLLSKVHQAILTGLWEELHDLKLLNKN